MSNRLPCKTPGCAGTILPATAQRTGGYCMPCVQAAELKRQQEHIAANRRDVDPYEGVTDPVEVLEIFHQPRKYDPLVNWIPHPVPTEQLYGQLSAGELQRLAAHAESLIGTERDEEAESILLCLAAFTDVQLDGCLSAAAAHGKFWPSLAFRSCPPQVRDEMIARLQHDAESRNHILLALAWLGDETVVDLFAHWRKQPPAWRDSLYVPPQDYSHEAGWELSHDGERRQLYFPDCTTLTRGASNSPDTFSAITERDDACPWCHQKLTNLIDLVPSNFGLPHGPGADRVQVTTCPEPKFSSYQVLNSRFLADRPRPLPLLGCQLLRASTDRSNSLRASFLARWSEAIFCSRPMLRSTFFRVIRGGGPGRAPKTPARNQ